MTDFARADGGQVAIRRARIGRSPGPLSISEVAQIGYPGTDTQTAARPPSRVAHTRNLLALALAVTFVAVVALAVLNAVGEARALTERRDQFATLHAQERKDELSLLGDDARAFRAFRQQVGTRARFALAFDPGRDPTLVRLLAHHYFYPAIEVADPTKADFVMGFGSSRKPPAGFVVSRAIGASWLAKRRSS